MKINQHNYEQFAIDYLEDQLDAATRAEFEAFLLVNPDIQEEMEALASFDDVTAIEQPSKALETADLLKMKDVSEEELKILPITEENYEPHVMEYLEGDLSPPIAAGMKGFLATNPQIVKEIEGLERITLTPDEAIFFPAKSKLKRSEEKPVFALYQTVAKWVLPIAALWAMFFFWNNWAELGDSTTNNSVVVNEPLPTPDNKEDKKLINQETKEENVASNEGETIEREGMRIENEAKGTTETTESIAVNDLTGTTNTTSSITSIISKTATKKTKKKQKRFNKVERKAKQDIGNKVELAVVNKVNQEPIARKTQKASINNEGTTRIIDDKNTVESVAITRPVIPSNNPMINWTELPLANNRINNTSSKQTKLVVFTPSTVKQSNINWATMPRSKGNGQATEAITQTTIPKEELMSNQKEIQPVATLAPITAMEVNTKGNAPIATIEVDLIKIDPIKANEIVIAPITSEGFLALLKAERSPLLPSNSFVASIEDFVPEILAQEVAPIKEKSFALALKIPLEKRPYQLVNRFIERLK